MLKEETLSQKFITKGFWLYFFTLIIAPSGYIIKLVASNNLSVEEVGVLYSVIGFIAIISTYHDFGLTESLNYFLPKFWIEKKYNQFKTVIWINVIVQFILGIIIAALLFRVAGFLAVNYFKSADAKFVLEIFIIYFVFYNIFNVLMTIYNSFQDVFSNKLVEASRVIGILIVTLIFFFNGTGSLFNYSVARVLGPLLGILLAIFIFFIKYKFIFTTGKFEPTKPLLKEYFGYSIWVLIGANAGLILGQMDQQMIIFFLGPEQAGYYTNFLTLSQIYLLIMTPLLTFLFPVVTELISKGQHEKLKIIQNMFYKYFTVIGVSLGGLFLVLGPALAVVLFGKKFEYSGVILQYTSIFIVLNILLQINFAILAGLGKIKNRVKILGIACLFNFILNLILIPWIGAPGAVIATVIGWGIMFVMSFNLIHKYEKIIFDWKFFIKNLIFIILLVIIIYYISLNHITLQEGSRISDLYYIVMMGLGYYITIALINYKELLLLKNEVMRIVRK